MRINVSYGANSAVEPLGSEVRLVTANDIVRLIAQVRKASKPALSGIRGARAASTAADRDAYCTP
jgi:hypothetical protein